MAEEVRRTGPQIRDELFKGVDRSGVVAQPTDNMSEFVFGDIWGGPGLDFRSRSLVTLGLLIGLNRAHELALHFQVARNNGLTREELVQVCLQAAPYAGLPASVDAQRILAAMPDPA